MEYQVTARKWRPRKFDEVVGQEHITATLGNALESGRLAHCYLFCGPRGVGKTTTARILAKTLNCQQRSGLDPCDECPSCRSIGDGTSMDVLEIDGASNNSVDDVRELREVVRYVPTAGAHKVYIIDEVHMLSTAAFNALLKTLEEPPERVVFVFATTEVQEVPETILSRCQRFNFRRISAARIAAHLDMIARAEGLEAEEDALFLLAQRADGALRDAESLLDQVASYEGDKVTVGGAQLVLGLVDGDVFFDLTSAIAAADAHAALDLLATVIDEGGDVEEFLRGLVEHVRHLLFVKVQNGAEKLAEVSERARERYVESAASLGEEDILRILQTLLELESQLRKSLQPRFRLEMTLVRLARMGRAVEVGELLQKLQALSAAPPAAGGNAGTRTVARPRRDKESGGMSAPQPSPPAAAPRQSPPQRSAPTESPDTSDTTSTDVAGLMTTPSDGTGVDTTSPDTTDRTSTDRTSTDTTSASTVDSVKAQWARIVAEVRKIQQPLGIFLGEAALKSLEGRVLTVAFPPENRFQMSQVAKSREVVEGVCETLLGESVRVRCVAEEVVEADSASGDGAPHTGSDKNSSSRDDVDPTVKSVLDTFDGELV